MAKNKKSNKTVTIESEVESVAVVQPPTKIAVEPESHILDRRIWRGIPRRELIRILAENQE